MPTCRTIIATALLGTLLAGCRIDAPAEQAAPQGYHRMPDGTLMADVAPDMEIVYRDIMGDGVELPTFTRPDGTIVIGANGALHNHPSVDTSALPAGVTPVLVRIPRTETVAPVVATELTSERIQGPPVAGDLAWLEQTRRPGEIGPAVIGGVRDLDGESGALAEIESLIVGDEFVVASDDGELLIFVVDEVGWSPVDERQDAVFRAGQGRPEVRLVAWWTGDPDAAGAADYVVTAHQIIEDPS